MEKEKNNLRNELISIGQEAEKNILAGESTIFNEMERKELRVILEIEDKVIFGFFDRGQCKFGATDRTVYVEQCDKGYKYEGGAKESCLTLSAQTAFMENILGREKLILLVSNVAVDLMDVRGGEIFKGKFLEGNKELKDSLGEKDVRGFISNFLNNGISDEKGVGYSPKRAYADGKSGGDEDSIDEGRPDDWKKNAMYRMEAIISATYRILEIVNADSAQAEEKQNDKYVLKDLRERVLRGIEKSDETIVVGEYVPRKSDDKLLRLLPKGGTGSILEHLVLD